MYQRSRYLIDPKVQWSIAGMITYHWAVFLLCLVTISAMVQVMAAGGHHPFVNSLASAVRAHIPILGMMVLMLPIFLRDMLKMTNRFAGPMYRLRLSLSSLANNRTTSKIRFRSKDFWQDVADDFNAVLCRMEELESELAMLKGEKECLDEDNETLESALSIHQGLASEFADHSSQPQAGREDDRRPEVVDGPAAAPQAGAEQTAAANLDPAAADIHTAAADIHTGSADLDPDSTDLDPDNR